MGSCVSVQKNEGAALAEGLPGLRSPGSGSKDEGFFDSQAWLEPDCEDDFFSVNGDITPSHGNSPNYQTGTPVRSQPSKSFSFDGYTDTRSVPSPRMKLAELLHTSPAGNEDDVVDRVSENNGKPEGDGTKMDHPPKSSDGTPRVPGTNSIYGDERTPDAHFKNAKGKSGKAMQCCLPSLVHSLSFSV